MKAVEKAAEHLDYTDLLEIAYQSKLLALFTEELVKAQVRGDISEVSDLTSRIQMASKKLSGLLV